MMNKDFEKGSILEFDTIGNIVVLGTCETDKLYILACVLKEEDNIMKADLANLILLKKEDDELYTETNEEVIKDVFPKILKKENIEL